VVNLVGVNLKSNKIARSRFCYLELIAVSGPAA
jgi:hypothetical protein